MEVSVDQLLQIIGRMKVELDLLTASRDLLLRENLTLRGQLEALQATDG